MNISEYQEKARRTQRDMKDSKKLMHALCGMASELAEIVERSVAQDYDGIVEECGDMCWFVAELCDVERIDMSTLAKWDGIVPFPANPWFDVDFTVQVGATLGIFQKSLQGHAVDMGQVKERLGNILKHVAMNCYPKGEDISLEKAFERVLDRNISKLEKRYPNGFSIERSVNRAD